MFVALREQKLGRQQQEQEGKEEAQEAKPQQHQMVHRMRMMGIQSGKTEALVHKSLCSKKSIHP
jgi:hypothetical protein